MKGQLTYYKKELLTKPLLFAYAIIFLYSFVNQLLVTPLTSYGLYFGISGTVMGVITNAYEFSCMAARNPAGYLVDRGRYRIAVCIAFGMIAATACLYSLANAPVMYGVVRFLNGFTSGYSGAVFTAILPAAVAPQLVGTATAVYTALSSLGSSYAPAISERIFTKYGFEQAYWVAAVAALGAMLLGFVLIKDSASQITPPPSPPDPPEAKTSKKRLSDSFQGLAFSIIPVCTIGLFANITKDMNNYYVVQLGLDRGVDVTTGIAIAGTLAIGISIVAGLLIDHGKTETVMLVCLACLSVSCFLYGNMNSSAMAIAAAVIYRIGTSGYWPALIALCCFALPGRRGAAVATLYFFLDIVSLVNNPLCGALYDWFGASGIYQVAGIINIVAVIYFLIIRNTRILKK